MTTRPRDRQIRIDFHTHIFPRDLCRNRESYFSGESEFALLYQSPKARLIGAEEMIAAMDKEGIDISVIFGFPWKKAENFIIHNDYIMASVEKYPGRFIGFCCMDPFHQEAAVEAKRCIEKGLSGIGEIAFYGSGINSDAITALAPLMAIGLEKDLPVLIHTNEPVGHQYPGKTPMTLSQIETMIRTFSKNKIVLAHLGGGILFYHLLKKGVKNLFKNVFFDTAASPFLYHTAIYRFSIDLVGADKILFGSDYPLIRPDRYLKEFHNGGVNKEDLDLICGKNAMGLLKLGNIKSKVFP